MTSAVHHKKLFLGAIYGITSGVAFSIFAWGIDAWLLMKANAALPLVKFIPGLLLCIPAGGLAGWLTMRFNKHRAAILFWGLLALFFSWLTIWLSMDGAAYFVKQINPSIAQYVAYSDIGAIALFQFRAISFIVVGFAAIVCGLLEINLIDQALLSPYGMASGTMLVVCVVLFSLAGSTLDHVININFREPVLVINELIQFAADHQGQEVPVEIARSMHLSAAANLEDLLPKSRRLTLMTFDPNFGLIDILVDFEGSLVKCTTIYAQASDCVRLDKSP